MTTVTVHLIPLTEVQESPLNPRRTFDPAKITELAQSIRNHGILTPLLMRRVSRNGKGLGYEIAAGHRRFRAAMAAGLQAVPAVVRDMEDAEFLEVLTIENLQREDLHPLEEATGYQALLKLPDYDIVGLAAKVAKSPTYIYQRLKLLELIPPARKLFLAGTITAAHAVHLARLQPADQKEALGSWVFRGRADHIGSAAELARWVAEEIHADLHSAPWAKDDATLVPAAGACTTCPKRSGFTPALFPDLAKKDTCTDRVCFQGKRQAFLARREAELRAGDVTVVRITTEYGYRPNRKGVLSRGEYWPAKKADPKAKLALITDGGQIGTTTYVTTERPKQESRGASNEPWQAEARKRAAKRAQEMVRRRRIFDAVRAKLPKELTPAALHRLAVSHVEEMTWDVSKVLLNAWGLEEPARKNGSVDVRGALINAIGGMTVPALVEFLQLLPLVRDLAVSSYSDERPKALLAAAFTVDVDVAAIDRALAAERKAAAAKKAARTAPTKKAKKAAGDVRRAKAATKRKAVAA